MLVPVEEEAEELANIERIMKLQLRIPEATTMTSLLILKLRRLLYAPVMFIDSSSITPLFRLYSHLIPRTATILIHEEFPLDFIQVSSASAVLIKSLLPLATLSSFLLTL